MMAPFRMCDTDIEAALRHKCRVCGVAVFGGDWQAASDFVHRVRRTLKMTAAIETLMDSMTPLCPQHEHEKWEGWRNGRQHL